ncbi:Membrane fusion protein of RND family multidrug efflux pump [Rhodopirellula islandica]|uniref:Membrane fusion protein of RND family multidrug efflux pump n=1 Tax=Rhodopirellula islandica TaxID=595434 RepID=A0A0J1B505_RHOIS|nr:efflux RND transporter periplasmic adaptor subunit [Rhodopirellula islandica]KLU01566.1 Membrane fusion protein of RND family multidrug efflux pump [Rhodopirellula islandica]
MMKRTSRTIIALAAFIAWGLSSNLALAQKESTSSRGVALYGDSAYEGFSQAIEDIYLGSEDLGRITEIPVKVGQRVQANDVIARLDDEIERASMEIAKIQASMVGEIHAAQASLDLQTVRVEHLRRLLRDEMAGSDELRRAEMELNVAKARLLTATEQRSLRMAEANRLELQWKRRCIRAPFDGVIAEKKAGLGATITPSDPEIVRLVRTDILQGVFNVMADRAMAMKIGMDTQVYFRAARKTVDGKIETIGPSINSESGTIEIRVRIQNPSGELRPGDRCTMRLLEPSSVDDTPESISKRRASGVQRW